MKRKKKGAYILIVLLVILFIANIVIAYPDNYNRSFYLRILSNILIILSMVLTIRHINKEENSEN